MFRNKVMANLRSYKAGDVPHPGAQQQVRKDRRFGSMPRSQAASLQMGEEVGATWQALGDILPPGQINI